MTEYAADAEDDDETDTSQDDPGVRAEIEKIESGAGDVTPQDVLDESSSRLRWVREAVAFCKEFTPGPVDSDPDVYSLDGLMDPAVRQARDLALVAAFRTIGDEFEAMRRARPASLPPFVLDVSRAGRG